jgi:hypothetical protein
VQHSSTGGFYDNPNFGHQKGQNELRPLPKHQIRSHSEQFDKESDVVKEVEKVMREDFSKFLQEWRQKLHLLIENWDNSIVKPSDFEKPTLPRDGNDPFDQADDFEGDKSEYLREGRKSYIRIKNKKNWPPTMEDLLEYISIYSQMNNLKFESLNHDKYIQIKSPKKSKKQPKSSKEPTKTHKKWKSISKADFTKINLTPREATQEVHEFQSNSMVSLRFLIFVEVKWVEGDQDSGGDPSSFGTTGFTYRFCHYFW